MSKRSILKHAYKLWYISSVAKDIPYNEKEIADEELFDLCVEYPYVNDIIKELDKTIIK